MSNQILISYYKTENNKKKKYDLEERTARFGEQVIVFCKKLPQNNINNSLINQLIRASTSIGANYMEADSCDSKKDFRHKIVLCKKEAKEALHWFRMISKANPGRKQEVRVLWKEAHELTLIFSKIILNSK